MLFERLEVRDYCRFDWRLDARGNPKLLEVNPNPGWCWDGHMAKMSKIAGMSYTEMLEAILQAAEQRIGLRPINGKSLLNGNGKNHNGNGKEEEQHKVLVTPLPK